MPNTIAYGTPTTHNFQGVSGSFAHTVGADVAALVVVMTHFANDAGEQVTVNGVNADLVAREDNAAQCSASIWKVDAPTAGSKTVAVSGLNSRRTTMKAYDVTCDGALAIVGSTGAQSDTGNPTVSATSAVDEDVVDALSVQNGTTAPTLAPDGSQTAIGSQVNRVGSNATNGNFGHASRETAAGAATTMSWTITGTHTGWALATARLQETSTDVPAPAAPENFTATPAGSGQVDLALTMPDDENVAQYTIRRDTAGYPATTADGTEVVAPTAVSPLASVSLPDTGLTDGTRYYYSAFTLNSEADASTAAEAEAAPLADLVPVNPLGDDETPDLEPANVPVEFTAPAGAVEAGRNGYWRLNIDGEQEPGIVNVWTAEDQTGWEVDTGGGYGALGATGVPAASLPADLRYTPTVTGDPGRYTWSARTELKAGE